MGTFGGCKMNVLVLGSSGQVGTHLVSYLNSKGHVVQEFDIVNDSFSKTFQTITPRDNRVE